MNVDEKGRERGREREYLKVTKTREENLIKQVHS